MLYSDINQAFNFNNNDGLYDKYSQNNNNKSQNINELKKNIIHNPNFKETFYNAQGDMEQNKFDYGNINNYYDENMYGTRIDDLKHNSQNIQQANNMQENNMQENNVQKNNVQAHKYDLSDTLSFEDNKNDNYIATIQKAKLQTHKKQTSKKHSCGYYMTKFIETIVHNDNTSITSSEDIKNTSKFDDIYDHVKKCLFCRSHINAKMKKIYKENQNNQLEKFEPQDITGSALAQFKDFDIKEIIIIILIGIVIIFVLDMFVKIGRKST